MKEALLELIERARSKNTYGPKQKGELKPGGKIEYTIPDNQITITVSELIQLINKNK